MLDTGYENIWLNERLLPTQRWQKALFMQFFLSRLEMNMETNLYEYDTTLPWIPQQNQLYEGRYVTAPARQQRPPVPQNQGLPQRDVGQKPKSPKPMPKARALALASTFKKWLIAVSLVGFVLFSGLVASHQIGTTTSQTSSGSSQATPTTSSYSQATPTTTSSSQNNNSFLNQQGGNNFGTSNSSQAPVTGSHTS